MTVGVSDFAATGIVTTFGGPMLVAFCVANFFRRNRINWYLLVPFIQAYITIGAYIAWFGPHLTTSPMHTVLLVLGGSTLSTVAVCEAIKFGTNWRPARFPIPASGFWGKFVGPLFIFYLLAIFMSWISVVPGSCDSRCRAYSIILGYQGYWGMQTIPTIFFGTISTILYFVFFVAKEMESQDGKRSG